MIVVGLIVVGLIAGGVYYLPSVSGMTEQEQESGALTYTVESNDILVTVTEDGNVESASNDEIKCQVAGGSTILWIVPDGTLVEEGAELVRLDASNLEDQLNTQTMAFEKANASSIQATEDYEASILAVAEYEEGTFVEELKKAEAEIRITQENLRSAQNVFQYTKKMVRKGFATTLQREADEFAVERSQLDLEAAETRRDVLVRFTKEKTRKDLSAKREASAAQARSDNAALELEISKKARMAKQLDNCIIYAPRRGMVVYANDAGRSRFGGSQQQAQIEEGATVRERQAIIRLPDLTNMQVKVTVHESKVDQLRRDMPARIVIQDQEYKGHVVSVANQPEPSSWMSANVKEYATTVAIDGETSGLRPGQTAHVEILIADLRDVLTVPVSSVVEQGGDYFCWVQTEAGPEKHPLKLGQTNDRIVEVIDGVKAGDVVLRNPRAIVAEARKEVPLEEGEADRSRFGESEPATEADPGDSRRRSQTGNSGRPAGSGSEGGRQGGSSMGDVPASGKAWVEKYDKDGDGKVVMSELDEQAQRGAQFWFSRMDEDGDQAINGTEADALVERMKQMRQGGGQRPDGAEAAEPAPSSEKTSQTGGSEGRPGGSGGGFNILQYDADGDGKVSKEEAPERMSRFFDRIDVDQDGFISQDDIEARTRQREQEAKEAPASGNSGGGFE